MAKDRNAWVTGYGCLSAAGTNPEMLWQSIVEERSVIIDGIGAISEDAVPAPRTTRSLQGQRYERIASTKGFRLALAAIEQAMSAADWKAIGPDDGIVLATTTGQIPSWEAEVMAHLNGAPLHPALERALPMIPMGMLMTALRHALDFRGRAQLISSACTASTHALALGARWVREGRIRRCLVGGVEVLSRLTIEGFRSLQLLSPKIATPFDVHRSGINLSEGAAFLCLEREKTERAVGQISGGGFSSDAYHMTAPHPEGRGSLAAMGMALEEAGLASGDISWVHAHGTGSPQNDLAEGAAIAALLGRGAPVTSTKGIHGHALGASGALESIICLEAIRRGWLPRTHALETPDPRITIQHPLRGRSFEIRHVLKSTLGFGGSNGAFVISAAEASS